jgi:succinylarginine dihydrolase
MNNNNRRSREASESRFENQSHEDIFEQQQEKIKENRIKNPRWTRIMRQNCHIQDSVATFLIDDDLLEEQEEFEDGTMPGIEDDCCLFDP